LAGKSQKRCEVEKISLITYQSFERCPVQVLGGIDIVKDCPEIVGEVFHCGVQFLKQLQVLD
jgi:hypothetical protein